MTGKQAANRVRCLDGTQAAPQHWVPSPTTDAGAHDVPHHITNPSHRVDAAVVDQVNHGAHGILLELVAEQQLINDVEHEHGRSSAQAVAQVAACCCVEQHQHSHEP